MIINKGQVELDPAKKIEPPLIPHPTIPDGPAPGPANPNAPRDKKVVAAKKEKFSYHIIGGLGQEEKAMIQRCKNAKDALTKKQMKEEKKLGKEILQEQNGD